MTKAAYVQLILAIIAGAVAPLIATLDKSATWAGVFSPANVGAMIFGALTATAAFFNKSSRAPWSEEERKAKT